MNGGLVVVDAPTAGIIGRVGQALSNPAAKACAKILVGGAVLAYAVQSGAADQAVRFVASEFADDAIGKLAGGAGGASVGAIVGKLIGGIGIAAAGGAVGVPAAAVTLAASLVGGMAGYSATSLIQEYLAPTLSDALKGGGLTLVGGLLVAQGLWELAQVCGISNLPIVQAGILHLKTIGTDFIVAPLSKFRDRVAEVLPIGSGDWMVDLGLAAIGWAAASSYVASTATLLGSNALYQLAVGASLMSSAPVWPVALPIIGAGALATGLIRKRLASKRT
ncbi:MAG: hypothetical protein EVA65_00925 [Oceanococcus sp.]|nr:MAG: hypothetical protein EVA65_00925 [Oceanococcus sp.]